MGFRRAARSAPQARPVRRRSPVRACCGRSGAARAAKARLPRRTSNLNRPEDAIAFSPSRFITAQCPERKRVSPVRENGFGRVARSFPAGFVGSCRGDGPLPFARHGGGPRPALARSLHHRRKPFIRLRKTRPERALLLPRCYRNAEGFNDRHPAIFYRPTKHHRLLSARLTSRCNLNRILEGNHRTAQQGWQT